jgi:hypothetical protein
MATNEDLQLNTEEPCKATIFCKSLYRCRSFQLTLQLHTHQPSTPTTPSDRTFSCYLYEIIHLQFKLHAYTYHKMHSNVFTCRRDLTRESGQGKWLVSQKSRKINSNLKQGPNHTDGRGQVWDISFKWHLSKFWVTISTTSEWRSLRIIRAFGSEWARIVNESDKTG